MVIDENTVGEFMVFVCSLLIKKFLSLLSFNDQANEKKKDPADYLQVKLPTTTFLYLRFPIHRNMVLFLNVNIFRLQNGTECMYVLHSSEQRTYVADQIPTDFMQSAIG